MPTEILRVQTQNNQSIPEILLGSVPGTEDIFQQFWTYVALALLRWSYEGFVAKAKGGTDQFGNRWKPLSPATIARRPFSQKELSQLGISELSGRGLLTEQQNKQWKAIFRSHFLRELKNLGERDAKKKAASAAWGILKARGARLKKDLIASRNVFILVVTKRLINSLKPNKPTFPYVPPREQTFEANPNRIRVGTSVPYAARLDQDRPIIPEQILTLLDDAIEEALDAVMPLIVAYYGRHPNSR